MRFHITYMVLHSIPTNQLYGMPMHGILTARWQLILGSAMVRETCPLAEPPHLFADAKIYYN